MLIQITYVLDTETKEKAVTELKLVNKTLSLPSNLPIGGRKRQSMGQASTGYVQDCLAAAKASPELFGSSIDISLLENKLATVQEMDDVLVVLEPLYNNSVNGRRLHGQDLMNACNEIMRIFEHNASFNVAYKATADKLKKRYARARKEESEAAKAAKAAEKAAQSEESGS